MHVRCPPCFFKKPVLKPPNVTPLVIAYSESDTNLGKPGSGTPPGSNTPRDTNNEELRECTANPIIENTSKRRKKKTQYKQSAEDINTDFLYDECAEIGNGYVEFTKHFCYLGTYVSYNLKDDYDINERIKQASISMSINTTLWKCPNTDMFSKYQLFLALVVTHLLWGCESWALKETSLNDIDVFFTSVNQTYHWY